MIKLVLHWRASFFLRIFECVRRRRSIGGRAGQMTEGEKLGQGIPDLLLSDELVGRSHARVLGKDAVIVQ